jgi:nucleotide-binding universal stress UspA family protein
MAETMVVGVNGTDDSLAALRAAAELAEESGASLEVVHVRHESVLAAESVGALAEAAMSNALDQVETMSRERASDVLSGRKVHWRFEVSFGDPATELIAAARASQATTIVVGGRSHGLIGGLVAGSVAPKLVRHSPVSVLVVRDGHAQRLESAVSGVRSRAGDA